MQALIFDCDGVLADTEPHGHRVAFNEAFRRAGLACEWDVPIYGDLLRIAGGKERMRAFFDETGWPVDGEAARAALVTNLHAAKTDIFAELIATGRLPLRPGVLRLVDEAMAAGMQVAICTTSQEKSVRSLMHTLMGPDRAAAIALFAGDIVPRKKPDPAIYELGARTLGVAPAACVVIEDSAIGLRAARAAGMPCIVTMSSYTRGEDFAGAALVVDDLGTDAAPRVTLADCRRVCAEATAHPA